MKKNNNKSVKIPKHYTFDKETLRRWKHTSTKAKLDWLSDAVMFFKRNKS